ncbi:AMP-binding protein [Corallococcus sp. bb12-1]|nr:AMP-binding protein [Corallococcus sp. bb12-1]
MPDFSRTLPGALLNLAAGPSAHAPLYTFLGEVDGDETVLSAFELDARARRIAAALQARGAVGERVLLLYPPGLDYVAGFFGCLYAGAVAVPAYPPDPMRLERTLPRLRAIIQDAQASVVLTTSGILELSDFVFEQAPDFRALHWMATDALPEGGERDWRTPDVGAQSLAFLQYTSGSTGTPKGVMLTNANLLHNLGLISGAFQVRRDSVGVIWLPPYHDMGLIGGILQPLSAGFPVALMSPMAFLQKPLRWLQAVSRFRGTISGGPNFAFELCARRATPEDVASLDLSSWEVAFCGAEPIRAATLERFAEVFGPSGFRREAFYPCYGLAEGTLIVTGEVKGRGVRVHPLEDAALARGLAVVGAQDAAGVRSHIGCGTTLAEQRVLVVEPDSLVPRAPGQVGEIWVSGASVAQGYWRKPELSESTFHARPAGVVEGPEYLRTGDLGVLTEDGQLLVTGRRKDLIILRGRNLYPQDVEGVIERADSRVRAGSVAAFSVETTSGEALAVVAEVGRDLADADATVLAAVANGLRQALARELEVQTHTVALLPPGAVPKTSSGKIQRFACRAALVSGELSVLWRSEAAGAEPLVRAPVDSVSETPTMDAPGAKPDGSAARDGASAVSAVATVSPSGGTVAQPSATTESAQAAPVSASPARSVEELERILREELTAVLGAEAGLQASDVPLTQLGMDSLAAADLQARIEKRLGTRVSAATLLQDVTLQALAASLSQGRTATGLAALPPVQRRPASAAMTPASFSQQRLWFLQQLAPESTAYHVPVSLSLRGPLVPEALSRSLTEWVRRHEALRTTFVARDGVLFQHVHAPSPVSLTVEDVASPDSVSREALLDAWAVRDAQQPMDMFTGPLLRFVLLRFAAEDHVLLVFVHHLIADGWSVAVLSRELAALYGAFTTQRPSPLPEPALQYGDFAAWQQAHLTPQALAPELAWWKQTLSGAPSLLSLATDKLRPQRLSSHGARRLRVLPAPLMAKLNALGRREGATPFMMLVAALGTVLHRWSGQTDFILGSATSGRDVPGTRSLVGDCTNFLPLRLRLPGDTTVTGLLSSVKRTTLEALAHGYVPYDHVLAVAQPGSQRRELYNVAFVLDDYAIPRAQPVGGGLTLDVGLLDNRTTELDMTFEAAPGPEGLLVGCKYATDLFEPETIDRLLSHLEVVVVGMVAAPETKLSELPVMTEAERHQVLHGWNPPVEPFPTGTLVERFEGQVERTPDAIAVTFELRQLTYRELDARANRLAHVLQARGVGPEVLVGVCLERGVELVVTLLGILKAGGAYLPLDSAHPREHLAFLLEDARSPLVLTQASLEDRVPSVDGTSVLTFEAAMASGASSSRPAHRTATGRPRVCHLHLGLHRTSQGRDGAARPRHAAVQRDGREVPLRAFGRVDAVPFRTRSTSPSGSYGARCFTGGRLVVVPYFVSRSPQAFLLPAGRRGRHRPQPDAHRLPAAAPLRAAARRSPGPGSCATSSSAVRRWTSPRCVPGSSVTVTRGRSS